MAKWGEGDPRWIVEERPDAVNVNNWHWTEKNACQWSTNKFKELFVNYKILHDLFKVRITDVEKADGEANANNRKGKLIFFYEWALTLSWKGKLKSSDDYVTGKLVIPNLSEENDLHEVDVEVSVTEKTADADTLRMLLYQHCKDKIREQLGKYIKSLKEEFAQGMILPKKENGENHNRNVSNITSDLGKMMKQGVVTSDGKSGAQLDLSSLKQSHSFHCTASELFSVFTVTELTAAFTQGPVKMDVRPGGAFELFGGNITGNFVELVPNEKIVKKWRVSRWPSGIYSTVTIKLKQESDHTELELLQEGLPASEVENTKDNWDRYYWLPIKRTFGYGSFL